MLLEVVVFNFHSALLAAHAGADRLELCDNYYEGGTTPSHASIIAVKEKLELPVFPMVRPRGGDFLYSDEEQQVMKAEILFFKQVGCEGVVLGCLKKDGTVDSEALARLTEIAYPMKVTFHRAFDRVKDQFDALETIIACGCKRILTSGGKPFAAEGIKTIKEIIDKASSRIGIIPGGGVNSENIGLLKDTGAVEFHTPARKMIPSVMEYQNAEMKENLECVSIDEEEIMKMKKILKCKDSITSFQF